METPLQYNQSETPHAIQAVQILYTRYAAMLLGYIIDIVKDVNLAEQYLADTFSAVLLNPDAFLNHGDNEYCKLQLLARKKMSGYFNTLKNCDNNTMPNNGTSWRTNKYLGMMTTQQQHIFCGLHYFSKTAAVVAAELGITEDVVRKTLKEIFVIIRKHNRKE